MSSGLSISEKRAYNNMKETIFEKDPVKFIPALAEALKNIEEFKIPEWAMYVKSGTSRERPPADDDFWYIRAASILRQLYIKGVVGVGKLRTRYGSKKDRGGRPDKFKKSGGKIIRVILQQAEAAGLVEKILRLQHGRRLTQVGRELLDSIEVESSKGLDFDNLKVVSKNDVGLAEIIQEDTENKEVIEEAIEISEDKGEEVVEEIKEESKEKIEEISPLDVSQNSGNSAHPKKSERQDEKGDKK